MKRDLEKDLKYKIIEYKRFYLHKLMGKRLYSLLDNFVSENDNEEYENFSNKLFRPIDIDIYDISNLYEFITDSSCYVFDLINQKSYIELLTTYQIHRILNELETKDDIDPNEIIANFISQFIEGETHRVFIHLLDNYDEKKIEKLIEEIVVFQNPNWLTFKDFVIHFFTNQLCSLLYSFLFSQNFDDDEIKDLAYNLDISKIRVANDNLIKILDKKEIFRNYITDTNLFHFFYSKSDADDFLKTLPLSDMDSAYKKIKYGIDDFFIIKYNTKSLGVAKLKETLLSDNLSYYKTGTEYSEGSSNYTYHFFLLSIAHYIISDDMVRYKHSYDLRRTENKNTFIKNTNMNYIKDVYFLKKHYELTLKYLKDFKRRESFFLIHLSYYMSINPKDALQIANVLGFYKHKSQKEALKTFNDDIVIFYPNFKLLKATSFFVKN